MKLFLCTGLFLFFFVHLISQQSDLHKFDLSGPVQSCHVKSFAYQKHGKQLSKGERSLLNYGGDGYEVAGVYLFDREGSLVESSNDPDTPETYERKVYFKNSKGKPGGSRIYDREGRLKGYEEVRYDSIDRPVATLRYSPDRKLMAITDSATYDAKGRKILSWKEEDVTYTDIFDSAENLIEEIGTFGDGSEYFHNYHKYNANGKRIQTTFTENGKVTEVRRDPYQTSVLSDGEIYKTDQRGNWLIRLYPFDDESGSMVERIIVYFQSKP